MNQAKLLTRIERGAVANVDFRELCRLAEALGFRLSRVSGSHHIFIHPSAQEIINLQDVGGEVKPYQVRQFAKLVKRYDLKPEGWS